MPLHVLPVPDHAAWQLVQWPVVAPHQPNCEQQLFAVQQTPLPHAPLVEMDVHLPVAQLPFWQVPPLPQGVPLGRLVRGLHVLVVMLQPPPVWQVLGVRHVVGQPAK